MFVGNLDGELGAGWRGRVGCAFRGFTGCADGRGVKGDRWRYALMVTSGWTIICSGRLTYPISGHFGGDVAGAWCLTGNSELDLYKYKDSLRYSTVVDYENSCGCVQ